MIWRRSNWSRGQLLTPSGAIGLLTVIGALAFVVACVTTYSGH